MGASAPKPENARNKGRKGAAGSIKRHPTSEYQENISGSKQQHAPQARKEGSTAPGGEKKQTVFEQGTDLVEVPDSS
jgi:hypothetical protein